MWDKRIEHVVASHLSKAFDRLFGQAAVVLVLFSSVWSNTAMHNRKLFRSIILAMTPFFISSCGGDEQSMAENPAPRLVRTLVVGTDNSTAWQEFPGKVEALKMAELSFRTSGELSALMAREGDEIQEGDVVATLDDRDQKIRLRAREKEFEQANADYQRGLSLIDSGSISRSDLQKLEALASTAKSNFEAAQRDLDGTRLIAPFYGWIAMRHVENFEEVSAMERIYTLQDISTLTVKVDIPESIMIRARREANLKVSALFDAFPGREFPLTLNEVATRASADTNTFEVTFALENFGDLNILPGMSAAVRLQSPSMAAAQDNLFAPPAAILSDGQGPYAFVAVASSEGMANVELRRVVVGALTGAGLQITAGLSPGDLLITAGMSKLQNGMPVRVQREVSE